MSVLTGSQGQGNDKKYSSKRDDANLDEAMIMGSHFENGRDQSSISGEDYEFDPRRYLKPKQNIRRLDFTNLERTSDFPDADIKIGMLDAHKNALLNSSQKQTNDPTLLGSARATTRGQSSTFYKKRVSCRQKKLHDRLFPEEQEGFDLAADVSTRGHFANRYVQRDDFLHDKVERNCIYSSYSSSLAPFSPARNWESSEIKQSETQIHESCLCDNPHPSMFLQRVHIAQPLEDNYHKQPLLSKPLEHEKSLKVLSRCPSSDSDKFFQFKCCECNVGGDSCADEKILQDSEN